ncbi:MAG: hypothetical protein Tsb009_39440 [Planctomycetaceae bacterium]
MAPKIDVQPFFDRPAHTARTLFSSAKLRRACFDVNVEFLRRRPGLAQVGV